MSQVGSSPQVGVNIKKYLKPPPRDGMMEPQKNWELRKGDWIFSKGFLLRFRGFTETADSSPCKP